MEVNGYHPAGDVPWIIGRVPSSVEEVMPVCLFKLHFEQKPWAGIEKAIHTAVRVARCEANNVVSDILRSCNLYLIIAAVS